MLYENSIYSASLSLSTSQVAPEVKNSLSNAGDVRDSGWIPGWWGRSPGEGNGNTLLECVFLPGECYGQKSLAGYSPWGHTKLDMTEAT